MSEEQAGKKKEVDPGDTSVPPRVSLAYPNVISVSHSNFQGIPRGINALLETPCLYIESETNLEFMVLRRTASGMNYDQFFESHSKLSAIQNQRFKFFYNIVDAFGRRLYIAQEDSVQGGPSRPFDMVLRDSDGQIIITIHRSNTCRLCFFGTKCRGKDLTRVRHPNGTLLGVISHDTGRLLNYNLLNEKNEVLLKVKSQTKRGLFFDSVNVKAKVELYMGAVPPSQITVPMETMPQPEPTASLEHALNEAQISRSRSSTKTGGKIKVMPKPSMEGLPCGSFNVITASDPNNINKGCVFGIQFPLNLTPETKALVLAAGILIDFTFCVTRNNKLIVWYGSGMLITIVCIFAIFVFMLFYLFASLSAEDGH